ncbi:unnamed protein product [Owenia fusiformis]|uniref:Uncharacterized protein n=1 Tax=Owenia fusiformis TaxID=6347 RepID=A0A8J1UGG7_OWEFU|nr:unnamed protein product [Owenia fusiformis]
MIGITVFNHLAFIVILMSHFPHAFECGKAKKGSSCETTRDDTITNTSEEGLVTFSLMAESNKHPLIVSPKRGLTKIWNSINPDVKTDADVIKKGRKFLAYAKQRYNVDMTSVSDTQLQMGSTITSANLTFMGYTDASNLRVVTETTPAHRTTYYRNTLYKCVGYALVATGDTFVDGGEWTGMMKKNSVIYEENCVIDSKECESDDGPHIMTVRTLGVHPPKFYKGEFTEVRTLEAEIESSKYGRGICYGQDIHPVFIFTSICVF